MKKKLTILLFLFNSVLTFGQSDITVLNGYKYVYLAPLNTVGYGIRSLVKEKLFASGLNVIESTNLPQGVDECLVVSCVIDHTNYGYQATSDYVYLNFTNCLEK